MDVDAVSFFESQFGLQLKRVSGEEYAGPCPWCNGQDRFRVWRDRGNYWCRPGPGHCGRSGFVDELTGDNLTNEEKRRLALEARVAAVERKQREMESRLSALEQMHGMMYVADHYYQSLTAPDNDAFNYWLEQGMEVETIGQYKLGYCQRCPTDKERRPSYTIPVIIRDKLYNIRHRLIGASDGDKYRPQMAGLPNVLFNADFLYDADPARIIITEGEKKSIILAQTGFPNVGIMGKTGFQPIWARKFERFQTVYVALDPDATEQAAEIAKLFGGRGRVVSLTAKVDDMIVKQQATREDIEAFIRLGRRI
jgi:DNA primase